MRCEGRWPSSPGSHTSETSCGASAGTTVWERGHSLGLEVVRAILGTAAAALAVRSDERGAKPDTNAEESQAVIARAITCRAHRSILARAPRVRHESRRLGRASAVRSCKGAGSESAALDDEVTSEMSTCASEGSEPATASIRSASRGAPSRMGIWRGAAASRQRRQKTEAS